MFVSAYVALVIAIAFTYACVYDYDESARHDVWKLMAQKFSEEEEDDKSPPDGPMDDERDNKSPVEVLTHGQQESLDEFLEGGGSIATTTVGL